MRSRFMRSYLVALFPNDLRAISQPSSSTKRMFSYTAHMPDVRFVGSCTIGPNFRPQNS